MMATQYDNAPSGIRQRLFHLIRDPRYLQMATLIGLVCYGVFALEFDVGVGQVVATLATVIIAQYGWTKAVRLPVFDARSAIISGLSLCMLLRANSWIWFVAAALLAISSKFVLRWKGRHIFNPTCFGIVTMLLLTDRVWVSAGQWGQTAILGFLFASVGLMVVHRAARSDVTIGFLASYVLILFGRAIWLGDPMAIPLHGLQNGALLLFAFFMISDPKTTPQARTGRIAFAALIAIGAVYVQFGMYEQNGLLWSLAVAALTVPIFDWFFTGQTFQWSQTIASQSSQKGGHDAKPMDWRPAWPRLAGVRHAGVGVLRILRR